ncbi:transposase [Candidatus Falkowbacteria bacterium]|nr:transposase [Candidatus Falkowbacteria bacterium]
MHRHRNSQKRFYDGTNTYFITTNTADRYLFFKEDILCELFVENLRLCKKLKEFELYAFSILPTHVHLLLFPGGKYNISDVMHAIKRHFSRDVNLIIKNKDITSPEGEDGHPRLQDGEIESRLQGERDERFMEIFREHDDKLKILKQKFIQKHTPTHKFPSFKWHGSFHDHVIRGDHDFQFHYDYTTYNPEQHKLVKKTEDYPWQSQNPKFNNFVDPA